jgi:hypothetical protein
MFVFRYLAALEGTKCILWCYLCWYVAIALQYFDPAPGLWISSVGIAGLIGFALNLAASQRAGRATGGSCSGCICSRSAFRATPR